MSRNAEVDYTQYVHEFEDSAGTTRYAVAEWNEHAGQYQRPLDKRSRELTGCSSEYSKRLDYFGGYRKRQQALRRARYLFGDQFNQEDD